MARVCLPREFRENLVTALKTKALSLPDLYKMTSAQRRANFAKYVPEEQVGIVNAKFEQAMLSNQKNSLKNWVISSTSAKDPIRKDLLKRVGRIQKVLNTAEEGNFLEDLVEHKLGIKVTKEETETIMTMKRAIDDAKVKIGPDTPLISEDRLRYGLSLRTFKNYVGDLKLKTERLSGKERLKLDSTTFRTNIVDVMGAAKAQKATLDLSYSLRQGIKALLAGDYKIWGKSFATSMKAFGKELFQKSPGLFKDRDGAVLDSIYADIYSRPNSLNGKYTAAKDGYNIGLLFEEAFPSHFPEKIPIFGRLFKASQTAYEAGAVRMRADYADYYIDLAEKNGVDMLDEANATAVSQIVGSQTGRAGLGRLEPQARLLNVALFAPRFLTSNFNTLTAHWFNPAIKANSFAVKEARKSTLKIIASISSLLTAAKAMKPDSVESDPRSTKFGKIKIGDDLWVDITGGMSGLAVLAARLFSGKTKSATGKIISGRVNAFGAQTSWDTLEQFVEGKFSPGAGVVRDFLKGSNFHGQKPSLATTIIALGVPISAENIARDLKEGNDDFLLASLLEGFGLSVSRDSLGGYSKQWDSLKDKHGVAKQNEALKLLTANLRSRLDRIERTPRWKNATQEERNKIIDKVKREETAKIMNRYGIK